LRIEAGVKESTATAAAEKATEYVSHDDLSSISKGISEMNKTMQHIDNRLAGLESKLNIVQWVVGGVGFALIAAVFIRLFQ